MSGYIGQARSNLDHRAGDSSGKEVCITKFTYSSSPSSFYNWTYVFRPKKNADVMANMCVKGCNNDKIGYSSNGTKEYGSNAAQYLAKKVDYDLSKITTKTGLSCGDLICLCSHYAGLSTCYLGSALQLANSLSKNSNYTKYSYSKAKPLQRGDVLITAHSSGRNNHVAMYLGSTKGLVNTIDIPSSASSSSSSTKVNTTTTSTSTSSSEGTYGPDTGQPIVLEKEIEQLYHSNNYDWFKAEETDEQKAIKERQARIKRLLGEININDTFKASAPTDVSISFSPMTTSRSFEFKLDRMKAQIDAVQNLSSYPNLVEAPSIEISFNGITIGGYGNTGDKYPNYITGMTVQKVNGRINKYSINLTYQIRAGEDPNFIDKLISRTGYTNPLVIKYGDSNSPGLMFKEESAVITDVKSNDNVTSSSISYTISAISSVTSADKSYYTFGEKTGKPSTIINDLLYNSGQVSAQLLTAFPAMTNRTFVSSNNLIPTTDKEVTVGGMVNVSPLTYLSHVVSCMTNVAGTVSSYFLTYNDSTNGAYFNISEVTPIMDNNTVYEIDVGYPGDNFITDFQLCDNIYWPLVYEYNGNIPKWEYDIGTDGKINKTKTNSLFTDNKFLSTGLINKNWWAQLTEFPISAKVTLKGLTVPVMLMTYIKVNTLFYGEKDIASGIYVVTDQTDSISGNGYSTTLTLLRVSE